jgi:hypothetical protein
MRSLRAKWRSRSEQLMNASAAPCRTHTRRIGNASRSHKSVAVFPENIRNSSSSIEVIGGAPAGARCLLMDKDNMCPDGDD